MSKSTDEMCALIYRRGSSGDVEKLCRLADRIVRETSAMLGVDLAMSYLEAQDDYDDSDPEVVGDVLARWNREPAPRSYHYRAVLGCLNAARDVETNPRLAIFRCESALHDEACSHVPAGGHLPSFVESSRVTARVKRILSDELRHEQRA